MLGAGHKGMVADRHQHYRVPCGSSNYGVQARSALIRVDVSAHDLMPLLKKN